MKNFVKEKIFLFIKISFFIVFWPFFLIYFLYKKYLQKRKEYLEKRKLEDEKWAKIYKQRQNDITSPLRISIFSNLNK